MPIRGAGHGRGRGVDFFRVACEHDLEGIVAKWKDGTYTNGPRTSWLKIRNPHYSQWEGRRDLFDARSDHATRRRQAGKATTRDSVSGPNRHQAQNERSRADAPVPRSKVRCVIRSAVATIRNVLMATPPPQQRTGLVCPACREPVAIVENQFP